MTAAAPRIRLSGPQRSGAVLAVALAAGACAAWSARQAIQERLRQIESSARVPMVERIVAGRDLAAGTRLDAGALAVRAIPREWAAADTLDPDRFGEMDGAVLERPVRQGDPVTPAHLSAARPASLAARLRSGRRAVTIPVDDIASQSGLLDPGDRIDLYVSFEHRRQPMTILLLQDVPVLATGRQTAPAEPGGDPPHAYATVTLDVAPADAARIVAARQSGKLTAFLRAAGDRQPAAAGVQGGLAGMLGVARPPVRRARVPVIYGDRAPAAIPGLVADEPAADGPAMEDAASPERTPLAGEDDS